jgi:hypothetical protein
MNQEAFGAASVLGGLILAVDRINKGAKLYKDARRAYGHVRDVYEYFQPPASNLTLPASSSAPRSAPASRTRMPFRGRRRRFRRTRRRRFRRRFGRRRNVVSAQAGNIINTRYRSRKLRHSAWSRALLADTRFKPHYRSLLTNSFTLTSPVGVNAATKSGLITLLPDPSVVGNFVFWSTPGGALPIDSTLPVPPFNDSTVVLRGGRSEVTIAVPGDDGVKLKVYMVYIKDGANKTAFNALTSVPTMWDPSHFVDFDQSFKLLSSREYILLPGSRPVSLWHKFRPSKIDWDSFRIGESVLAYVFTIQQLTDTDVLPAPVVFTVSHSVSFVADII